MKLFRTHIALFSLVLASLVVLPAAAQQPRRSAIDQARDALRQERYSEAISILNTILTGTPNSPEALILRGQAYEGRGDLEQAIQDYERALEADPNNTDASRRRNQAQSRRDQANRANLDNLRRLADAQPNNLQLRLQYANALLNAGIHADAAAQYEIYLSRVGPSPNIVQNYLTALASYSAGIPKAEEEAVRFLDFYPTDPDLWTRLGYFRLWQQKYELAEEAFDQALLLDPNNQSAIDGRDRAQNPEQYAPPRQLTPIERCLAETERNPANEENYLDCSQLLIDAGRFFEAQQLLAEIAPRWNEDFQWQRLDSIATAELQSLQGPGEQQEFIVDRLQRLVRENPNDDDLRFQLVDAFIEYERYFEAFDTLLPLEEEYGETRRWLERFVLIDEGFLATTGGSPIYSIDRFNYLLRFDPGDDITRFQLIDTLAARGRIAEAFGLLTDERYIDQDDARYQARLASLNEERLQRARERIVELERRLDINPNDRAALLEIIDQYQVAQRTDDALDAYERMLQLEPQNDSLRIRYAQVLQNAGDADYALQQSIFLLQQDPDNPAYRRLYVLASVSLGEIDPTADEFIQELLVTNPDDVELLFALAGFQLTQGNVELAEDLAQQAYANADRGFETQIETLLLLIERENLRLEEAEETAILNEAQGLAKQQFYQDALYRYEDHFQEDGRRKRDLLKQLGGIHSAAGDFVSAISIYEALLEQMYEYDAAKELAKNTYYRQDYSGVILLTQMLVEQNPNDFEAYLLMADSYRELQYYDRALEIYRYANTIGLGSPLIEERIRLLEQQLSFITVTSRPMTTPDFGGVLIPSTEAVIAGGSGTRFERWAQAMQTQITLPAPLVIQLGVKSHFLSGTQLLRAGSAETRGRVNQVYAGAFLDLTPTIQNDLATYTNRLQAEAGLFDYEGGRTVPYASLRYLRQEPELYIASVGAQVTEGSIALWSPAGGEYDLKLTQVDFRGETSSILPDSVFRVKGVVAFNYVSDDFGFVNDNKNAGLSVQFEPSYRILRHTWLGMTYYHLGYQSTTDLYFSPRRYDSYDFWLEYLRNVLPSWYFRLRGAVGSVARSNGFISRRVEAEWIYRILNNITLTTSLGIGQSSRAVGNAGNDEDGYSTFTFSATLYWRL